MSRTARGNNLEQEVLIRNHYDLKLSVIGFMNQLKYGQNVCSIKSSFISYKLPIIRDFAKFLISFRLRKYFSNITCPMQPSKQNEESKFKGKKLNDLKSMQIMLTVFCEPQVAYIIQKLIPH